MIAEIEDSPEEVKEILDEGIINVYAKLNYAYHSAEDGPEALMQMSDDDIISFPPVLPMYGTPALCRKSNETIKKFRSLPFLLEEG